MHTLLLLARLGLFALSLAGWCLWAARRFALPVEQTPLVAISAIGCAMCGAGLGIQVASFLVVSLVLLIFTRPFAVRFLSKDTLKTNVDRVIGMEGVVTEEISNLAGTGKVSLGGNIWTARTENEGGTIPVDAVVAVLRVEGVKLIVKFKEKEGGNET